MRFFALLSVKALGGGRWFDFAFNFNLRFGDSVLRQILWKRRVAFAHSIPKILFAEIEWSSLRPNEERLKKTMHLIHLYGLCFR